MTGKNMNQINRSERALPVLLAILASSLMLASSLAIAQQACDITDLDCWGEDKKCNIKFRNKTGEASGSGGGTPYTQFTQAASIKVMAVDEAGEKVGQSLKILAGATKTLNLDKKSGFDRIKIQNTTDISANYKNVATLHCEDVRTILIGTGKCKIFAGKTKDDKNKGTYYNCDGGNVVSPPPE